MLIESSSARSNQAAWSVSGNSQYVVLGGEFPSVNGVAQQGLRAELGERQPRSRILRGGGDDRAQPGAGVLVIAACDCGRRVLAQLLDALALQLRPNLSRLLA